MSANANLTHNVVACINQVEEALDDRSDLRREYSIWLMLFGYQGRETKIVRGQDEEAMMGVWCHACIRYQNIRERFNIARNKI
ncbi:hypothetical protein Y032_0007g3391 [Ancylostoma ceylanicum]|uniref:Uncharacterized protein n=1 Tax=Ancylostoma ceylanicum TaxID=53326 RepID=A0A016VMU0_9BILA|nr:hypothetical protein Y032_0007g3391 [Ancylostoma ceylanicum]